MNEDVLVRISLKKLIEEGLSAEEYLFLYLCYMGERWKLSKYQDNIGLLELDDIKILIDNDFLYLENEKYGLVINNLSTTDKFKNIVEGKIEKEKVENWIEEWYSLWPSGIKSGGYYIKTDKKGSLRKMKRFLLSYPDYDREIIMKATENYIREQSIKGYSYTKLAPYFIEKDGLSILAGECEAIIDNKKQYNNEMFDIYGAEEL